VKLDAKLYSSEDWKELVETKINQKLPVTLYYLGLENNPNRDFTILENQR
jgi:hypothetical protein